MSALADHLWQSTWFAIAAWLLTLLLSQDAKLRYWIWFAASFKFLIPFSLLTLLGHQLVLPTTEQALLPLIQDVAAPLAGVAIAIDPLDDLSGLLAAVWIVGTIALLARWLARVVEVRAVVRNSTPSGISAAVPVRCSREIGEPGIVGVVSPVLLIPENLLIRLSHEELDCVIAHELWHVRRRDNLTASIHVVIEALFWFHPLVWWIGARLVDAREHACDEGALNDGVEPRTYAQALLRVCRHSIEAREPCIANATGGDLAARVRSIMSENRSRFMLLKRAIAVAAASMCIVIPVIAGITIVRIPKSQVPAGSQFISRSDEAGPSFVTGERDYVLARNVSLRQLISHAYAVDDHDVKSSLPWLDYPRYNVELRAPADASMGHRDLVTQLLKQQFNVELVAWPRARPQPQASGLDF